MVFIHANSADLNVGTPSLTGQATCADLRTAINTRGEPSRRKNAMNELMSRSNTVTHLRDGFFVVIQANSDIVTTLTICLTKDFKHP
jgi:hypothetical protein